MKIFFYTLGCKVNQYETQLLREAFLKQGEEITDSMQSADVCIVNSCTVTAESDRKTRQAVRKARQNAPNAVIILTGCMPQAFPEEADALESADIVTGNGNSREIPELLRQFLQSGKRIVKIVPHSREESFPQGKIHDFCERTRAYLKIEDGCERYCTYCIIPKARGAVRSKPLNEIRKEAEGLAADGFLEVVLVGINLSAFGTDSDTNLCDAVDAVAGVEGIRRVRLGSLEPDHIRDEVLLRLRQCPKFCPQFHLSLQSGCDRTLKRMNRHYDTAFYRDLVERIRKIFPDASITTDIMVGFAGETPEEFSQSLAFEKEIGFAKVHIFAYSRRKGTVAYSLPDQISAAQKEERSHRMAEAALQSEREFLQDRLHTVQSVLFESKESDGCYFGYTPNYIRVRVASEVPLTNQILPVYIESSDGTCLNGRIAADSDAKGLSFAKKPSFES